MSKLSKTGLFYYTSVDTMRYILTGANLFATNLLYMNDSEEYSNGLRELREILNEKAQEQGAEKRIGEGVLAREIEMGSDSYSISFSVSEDLLSQWSMYAGESGVSLKFCFNGREKYEAYDSSGKRQKFDTEKVRIKLKPERVFYCTRDAMEESDYDYVKEEIWKEICERYYKRTVEDLDGNVLLIWRTMTPYVKRYEFKAEGEYRLVINAKDFNADQIRIDYRNDKQVLKPYIDLKCTGGWPIEEIMVGPGFNQKVVFRSVFHFLNHAVLELPVLSVKQFLVRCETYLQIDHAPQIVKDIWEKEKQELASAAEKNIYPEFCKVLDRIKTDAKAETAYLNELQQRALTRRGIILRMSEIPYIF